MTRYYVHVTQDWVYMIDADSAEEAAQYIDDGDAPPGDCTGYEIDAVTLDEHGDGEDERKSGRCKGCAKELKPDHFECRTCYLMRIKSELAGHSGVGTSAH